MFGSHVIKHWPATQTIISISSGEAEYYGCIRAGSHTLGLRRMLSDLGVIIEVNQFWLQEKVNNGEIQIEKVMGITIRADALTKPKQGGSITQHLLWTSEEVTTGRVELAPKLAKIHPLEET